MIKRILLFFVLVMVASALSAQTKTVTGTVTDASDGLPLVGANVLIQGTTTGSQTDLDGTYTLSAQIGDVLVFSFLGMQTQSITVGASNVIDVSLFVDAEQLSEVVVTALGMKREERALGYAVSEIKGNEIAQVVQVNPVNAIQGKMAGVQISTTSGGTFGGTRITVRGNSTFDQNTQPIFVVDGVILDNDVSGEGGADWGNQLKNLNPDDFETFSVLKGAAASALYGTRAINGVVIVTTKSGSKRKGLGVSVNQTVGIRTVYDTPDFQNEYGSGLTAGGFSFVTNGPNTRTRDDSHDTRDFFTYDLATGLPSMAFDSYEEHAASWGPRFDGQEIIDYDGSRATWVAQPNNYKDYFDKGVLRNTNVAIDGGSETSTFRLSFSNFSESGVELKNDFGKNSLSFKGTHDLIQDKLTIGATMHYTRSTAKNPLQPGGLTHWFHDGFPRNYDVNKWRNNYLDVDGGVPHPFGNNYNFTRMSRIWAHALEDDNVRTEGSFISNINLNYKLNDNISATIEGNLNQYTYNQENRTFADNRDRLNGGYFFQNGERFQNSFSAKLFFNKEVNEDIQMDLLVGGELWTSKEQSNFASTSGGFKIRDFYAITNSRNPIQANGGIGPRKKINSVYAFYNIAYKRALYLTLTARNDWSSALVYPNGQGNNSYFYPSTSLAWVASESLALPEFISFAKLRASYAIVGNDTDPYRLSTGFVADNFNQNQGLNMFRFENNTAVSVNLKPEKKYSFETGIDIRFFKNRLALDVAYYKDNNKNQIISLPVPSESGIDNQLINAGNLQNQGVEASLNIRIIDKPDFSWSLGANATHNRDKIIELAPGINEFRLYGNPNDANSATASFAYVGGNYGDLVTRRGYDYYNGENSANHDLPVLANRNGWSVAYPIGIQNMDSLYVMGNMQADLHGGINTYLRYKRLHLSALVDAKIGGEIYSADARYGLHQGVLNSSLPNRDASQGGITWTSQGQGQNVFGKTYEDGYIPEGVFPDGTVITYGPSDNRTTVDVGGMTYQQAYDQGLVEPTHWSGYIYRWTSASTGTPITGVYTSSWVGLREVTLSYDLPSELLEKAHIRGASLSVTGRDLGFLYNSLPDNINPTLSSNAAANPLQQKSSPYIRSISFSLKLTF